MSAICRFFKRDWPTVMGILATLFMLLELVYLVEVIKDRDREIWQLKQRVEKLSSLDFGDISITFTPIQEPDTPY